MKIPPWSLRLALAALMIFIASPAQAQPATKKIRMGISTTSIVFLPFYAAMHKGFYKDEGIDLELIVMPATLASTAVVTGDVDYNGNALTSISTPILLYSHESRPLGDSAPGVQLYR